MSTIVQRILAGYGDLIAGYEAQALVDLAEDLGLDAGVLADLIYYESGWDPSRVTTLGTGATGLIQFMPRTAEWLGVTTELLQTLSITEQLPWVKEYFRRQLESVGGRFTGSEADHYMLVFYPAAVGKPDYEFPQRVLDAGNKSATPEDYAARVRKHAGSRYVGPASGSSTASGGGSGSGGGSRTMVLLGLGVLALVLFAAGR